MKSTLGQRCAKNWRRKKVDSQESCTVMWSLTEMQLLITPDPVHPYSALAYSHYGLMQHPETCRLFHSTLKYIGPTYALSFWSTVSISHYFMLLADMHFGLLCFSQTCILVVILRANCVLLGTNRIRPQSQADSTRDVKSY